MKTIKLFLSSPGDVGEERKIINEVIESLNDAFKVDYGVEIKVYAWEDFAAGLHEEGAQGVVDDTILPENCELVVGILWKRFGTPAKGFGSGTEYELRTALNKWELTKKPRIMLYFSMMRASPKEYSSDQLAKVQSLQKEFEGKGLVHRFKSRNEFKRKFGIHIKQYMQQRFGPKIGKNTELRSIPSFPEAITRLDRLSELKEKSDVSSTLLIEGISGSGKTYLLSSFFHSELVSYDKEYTFWYKASKNDSLEKLFLSLEEEFPIPKGSMYSKSKYVFNFLKARGGVLVIDDFENVDFDLSREFFRAVSGMKGPAVVILLSTKNNIPDIQYTPKIYRVTGYDKKEVQELFEVYNVPVSQRLIGKLLSVTNGLPVVVKLFIKCIVEAGYSPEDLLEGQLIERQDYQNWYEHVENQLTENERKLLSYLSLCDDLFDLNVLKCVSENRIKDYQVAFEGLQSSFLIENYKRSNWRVHPFIAHKARRNVKSDERTIIYSAIASEYHDRVKTSSNIFKLSSDEILFYIKAGIYYKKAGVTPTVEFIIKEIRRILKKRGDFGILYELTAPVEDELIRDWWLDYHYVHSCLVIGKFREVKNKTMDLLQSAKRGNERVLASKLYAELENIYGENNSALSALRKVAEFPEWSRLRNKNVKNIVRLYRVNTLIRLEREKEAESLRRKIENQNKRPSNYTAAINKMLKAWIEYRKHDYKKADNYAKEALKIFQKPRLKDNRGLAWSMEMLAIINYELGLEENFKVYMNESLKLRSEIKDCSLEYFDFIDEARNIVDNITWVNQDVELKELLKEESTRVDSIYMDIRS
jgi:hypothetical protein